LSKGGLTKDKFVKHFQENSQDEHEEDTVPKQVTSQQQIDKVLNQYCTNLSTLAKQKKFDPVIGSDEEL
jgi:ATP-dependent Clp protease ATP-binding subunit ClpA